jgi:hypothetical protein
VDAAVPGFVGRLGGPVEVVMDGVLEVSPPRSPPVVVLLVPGVAVHVCWGIELGPVMGALG